MDLQHWDKRYTGSNKMEEGMWRETDRKRSQQEREREREKEQVKRRWIDPRYLIDSKTDGHTLPGSQKNINLDRE